MKYDSNVFVINNVMLLECYLVVALYRFNVTRH